MGIGRSLIMASVLTVGIVFNGSVSADIGAISQHSGEAAAGGTWFFNNANGRVSFCVSRVTSLGVPAGKCSTPVSTTTSTSGFEVQVHASSIWITSKSNESVYQCSYNLISGMTTVPAVTCTLIWTLAPLH